jgi:predicted DNA-binding transcriptional regulator AlpA
VSPESQRHLRLGASKSMESTVPQDTMHDELLDAAEVVAILKVRVKRVYELGVPALRVGPRTLRWRRSDLEKWLASRQEAA